MPRAAGISPGEAPEIEYGGLNNLLSFPLGTTPLLLPKILGFAQAAKMDLRGLSRADSSGSGHLPEWDNPMGDSGSDAGASIHASFRNLHRAAAPGVCGVKKKSVSFRLLGRVRSFHGL